MTPLVFTVLSLFHPYSMSEIVIDHHYITLQYRIFSPEANIIKMCEICKALFCRWSCGWSALGVTRDMFWESWKTPYSLRSLIIVHQLLSICLPSWLFFFTSVAFPSPSYFYWQCSSNLFIKKCCLTQRYIFFVWTIFFQPVEVLTWCQNSFCLI